MASTLFWEFIAHAFSSRRDMKYYMKMKCQYLITVIRGKIGVSREQRGRKKYTEQNCTGPIIVRLSVVCTERIASTCILNSHAYLIWQNGSTLFPAPELLRHTDDAQCVDSGRPSVGYHAKLHKNCMGQCEFKHINYYNTG